MNCLQLELGNRIEQDGEYTTQEVQGKFSLTSKLNKGKLYTLLLIDKSLRTGKGVYLHYLAVNVVPHYRRILTKSLNPKPPLGTTHEYAAILFEQPRSIDIPSFKKRKGFPVEAFVDVHGLKEIERIEFSVHSPSNSYTKEHYFVEENPLTDQQKKVCRCYLHVSEKNRSLHHSSRERSEERVVCKKDEWGRKGCYHPYKTCGKSVGTSYKYCSEYYDFEDFTDDELRGYARAHGIEEKGKSSYTILKEIRAKLEK